jgi:hypothetical protein
MRHLLAVPHASKKGRDSMRDVSRSGNPITEVTKDKVQLQFIIIVEDHHLTYVIKL